MLNKQSILYAIVLFLWIFAQTSSSQKTSPKFPQSVINAMAAREMRYHHYLWHNIRENWYKFSSTSQAELKRLKWAPPRPGRKFDENGVSSAIPENNSGEDFLYMHRQMIANANAIIAKNKDPYGKITGWTTIPGPNDTHYPVPAEYNITDNPGLTSYTNFRKTADYYETTIKPMEALLKNPVELRKMTLGQLGSKIEVTIHSWMHMRFSGSSSYGYRPVNKTLNAKFDKKWDVPEYDWLGDTYASHVNPVFWKLHGWVDDRIEDWRKANRLSSIRWKGTWVGGPMSSFSNLMKKEKTSLRVPKDESSEHNSEMVGDTMEKVLDIVMREGAEFSFADNEAMESQFLPK